MAPHKRYNPLTRHIVECECTGDKYGYCAHDPHLIIDPDDGRRQLRTLKSMREEIAFIALICAGIFVMFIAIFGYRGAP